MDPQRQSELASLLKLGRRVRAELPAGVGVTTESVAQHELDLYANGAGSSEPIERVIRVADTWTEVTAQYVGAMAEIVDSEGQVSLGLMPLCRAVIEHCAAVQWVLDNTTDAEERAARAAILTDVANEAAVTAASHLAPTSDQNPAYDDALERMRGERERIKEQFPHDTNFVTVNKGDKVRIGGVTRPRASDLVERLSRDKADRSWLGAYDYLSAAGVHPGLLVLEHATPGPSGGGSIGLDQDFAERLLQSTVAPYHEAILRFVEYCGWSHDDRKDFLDEIERVLNP